MPATRHWLLLLPALAILATGCGKNDKAKANKGTGSEQPPADPVQVEADLLGRDLYDIMDRVMAYATSHRRLPNTLSEVGIDSLAPLLVRRLSSQGTSPRITTVFRRTEGRSLTSCSGTNTVLEEATINGVFTLGCELVTGGNRTFSVDRMPPPPPKAE